ncbi:MAG: hypothetical protein Q9213_001445 [Squamulea squamosa]
MGNLFFYTVFGLPATITSAPSLEAFEPKAISTLLNNTLANVLPPWGPSFFTVDISDEGIALDRRVLFVTVISLLASQATLDFQGPLPENINYHTPQFPNLGIIVYNSVPNRPIKRKMVYWAMTRIMKTMVEENHFRAAIFEMKLREQPVGIIRIRNVNFAPNASGEEPKPTVDSRLEDAISAQNQINNNAISAGETGVTFTYRTYGDALAHGDIFMVTVGALVWAAGETRHDFTTFYHRFPGHPVFTVWESQQRPSRFTFDMLVSAIVGSAKFVVARNNYRELRGTVKVDGLEVAKGGWFRLPSMSSDLGLGAGQGMASS